MVRCNRAVLDRVGRTLASMEPCLFRHGKVSRVHLEVDPVDASMEPCLFRHGKEPDDRDLLRGRGLRASMEPCLFRHGKRE